MKQAAVFVLSALALALFAPAAQAFDPGACHPDIEKFCKNEKIADGELKACLKKHLAQLSDPCKANLVDLWLEKKRMDAKK